MLHKGRKVLQYINHDRGNPPVFGKTTDGKTYTPRPGAYAVIFDNKNRVAVMQNTHGFFLPGGGIESEETIEESLRREVLEECGYEVHLQNKIGEAIDYIITKEDEKGFQIHGTFFKATFDFHVNSQTEADHTLVWLTPSEAIQKLDRQGQAWAIQQALEKI